MPDDPTDRSPEDICRDDTIRDLHARIRKLETDYANLSLTVTHLGDLCDTICQIFAELAEVAKTRS